MTRLLAVFCAVGLSACVPRTKVVYIERTRLILPIDWFALTAATTEPAICQRINRNGELFQCRIEFRTALQQCNFDKQNLRSQYEQVQRK